MDRQIFLNAFVVAVVLLILCVTEGAALPLPDNSLSALVGGSNNLEISKMALNSRQIDVEPFIDGNNLNEMVSHNGEDIGGEILNDPEKANGDQSGAHEGEDNTLN